MDARKHTALVPLNAPDRLFPYPNEQGQGTGDDTADANLQQDSHATQRKGKKAISKARLWKNTTVDTMAAALAKTTLRDEKKNKKRAAKVQPADGVQKKKRAAKVQPANGVQKKGKTQKPKKLKQHNIEQVTAALEGASLTGQEGAPWSKPKKGATSSKKLLLKSKKGSTLPLAFDSSYLEKMGRKKTFMQNDDVRTWISSVSHHLKDWYRECVCDPANEADLRAAQSSPLQFADAVFQHEFKLSGSAKQTVGWRTAGLEKSAQENEVVSNFVQLTGIISRRIESDGQRGGGFARSKQPRHIRYAAIMLLVTVIMDLTVNMGYFVRLFLGVRADLTAEDERVLLALGSAPESPAEPTGHRSLGAVPRTLQVPADLFGFVRKTFENLPNSTGCRTFVHPPIGPGLARYIVLIGSTAQMDEAENVITKVMETSATPFDVDLP